MVFEQEYDSNRAVRREDYVDHRSGGRDREDRYPSDTNGRDRFADDTTRGFNRDVTVDLWQSMRDRQYLRNEAPRLNDDFQIVDGSTASAENSRSRRLLDAPASTPPPEGYDATKWYNTDHDTPKYAIGRAFAPYMPEIRAAGDKRAQQAVAERALNELKPYIEEELGLRVLDITNETMVLDFRDGTTPHKIDLVRAIGADSAQQWLDEGPDYRFRSTGRNGGTDNTVSFPPPEGYDAAKWYNPDHNTPKYAIGREFAKYMPEIQAAGDKRAQQAVAERALHELKPFIENQLGLKVHAIQNETMILDLMDGNPPRKIDLVRAIGADSAQQWLDEGPVSDYRSAGTSPRPSEIWVGTASAPKGPDRPVEVPIPESGAFDHRKWMDPSHRTIKYEVGRAFQEVMPFLKSIKDHDMQRKFAEAFLMTQVPLIESQGGKVYGIKNEVVYWAEPGKPPHAIDTIQNIGSDNPKLQWLPVDSPASLNGFRIPEPGLATGDRSGQTYAANAFGVNDAAIPRVMPASDASFSSTANDRQDPATDSQSPGFAYFDNALRTNLNLFSEYLASLPADQRAAFMNAFLKSQIKALEAQGARVHGVDGTKMLLDGGDGRPKWIDVARPAGARDNSDVVNRTQPVEDGFLYIPSLEAYGYPS